MELGNVLDDRALHHLADSSIAGQLKRLELFGVFSDNGMSRLFGGNFEELESLTIHRRPGAEISLSNLVNKGNHLEKLRQLTLTYGLEDEVLENIAQTKFASLESLDLSNNQLTDVSVRALASSPLLAQLKRLTLTGNQISVSGVEALVASEYWRPRQTKVYLRGNSLNRAESESLKDKYGKSFGNFGVLYW